MRFIKDFMRCFLSSFDQNNFTVLLLVYRQINAELEKSRGLKIKSEVDMRRTRLISSYYNLIKPQSGELKIHSWTRLRFMKLAFVSKFEGWIWRDLRPSKETYFFFDLNKRKMFALTRLTMNFSLVPWNQKCICKFFVSGGDWRLPHWEEENEEKG